MNWKFRGRTWAVLLSCVVLLVAVPGCSKKAAGPAPRYAVLRFENLSGDQSLEWMGRAASELLSRTLVGALDGPVLATISMSRLSATLGSRPQSAPGISTERDAAQVVGASRVIVGYFERTSGGVRVTGTEQDVVTGKALHSFSAVDSSPLRALTQLAREFSPKAGRYDTENENALRLYSASRELPLEKALGGFEQSIQADPDFGSPWLSLVQAELARGDRPAAAGLIAKARQQKLDKLTLANLDLDDATLRGDEKARVAAMRQVSDLSPGDTVLLRVLAQTQASGGLFKEAAVSWKKLADVLPEDPEARNQLGYTQAWSGDPAAAEATLKEYARLRPADPNPLDSLGDVQYMYRKFPEAARTYLQAYAKSPEFQGGGDLDKAAWAKFRAGDLAGADGLFAQFRKARGKSGGFSIVAADWLYRTGRRQEALQELRQGLQTATAPAEKTVLYDQLAVWSLLNGDRVAAAKSAVAAGQPTTPVAFLVLFCSMPSASPAEWEARAVRMASAPAAAGLRRLAVGYALLLDGKREAALPFWKQISEGAAGTDFTLRWIYTKLRGEQPPLLEAPDPGNVNSFAAVVPDAPVPQTTAR